VKKTTPSTPTTVSSCYDRDVNPNPTLQAKSNGNNERRVARKWLQIGRIGKCRNGDRSLFLCLGENALTHETRPSLFHGEAASQAASQAVRRLQRSLSVR
jgi:hypothetical protein